MNLAAKPPRKVSTRSWIILVPIFDDGRSVRMNEDARADCGGSRSPQNRRVISRSMNPNMLTRAAQLSDSALLARVTRLALNERHMTAALVAHLAELDARRLYLAEGCSSLFTYCTQVLHLSEHAAYGRIEAARAARRFPVLLEHLADGWVNLTTVCSLAPHLTDENHAALLEQARHRSKRAVEELVAWLRPQPPVPDAIRKLPTHTPAPSAAPAQLPARQQPADPPLADVDLPDHTVTVRGPTDPLPSPGRPAAVTLLAPRRYKVVFTASDALHAKLRQAQALLRHQIPNGDLEQIFDKALTALLEDLTRQKAAETGRPRAPGRPSPRSRHIPAAVRRTVWTRDGGRCTFVATNGRRCTEEGFLEFHHITPYATGGPATAENIQLRCRAHNAYEAERTFGQRLASMVREEGASYMQSVHSSPPAAQTSDHRLGPDRARPRAQPAMSWPRSAAAPRDRPCPSRCAAARRRR
jgi:hypothetical protein